MFATRKRRAPTSPSSRRFSRKYKPARWESVSRRCAQRARKRRRATLLYWHWAESRFRMLDPVSSMELPVSRASGSFSRGMSWRRCAGFARHKNLPLEHATLLFPLLRTMYTASYREICLSSPSQEEACGSTKNPCRAGQPTRGAALKNSYLAWLLNCCCFVRDSSAAMQSSARLSIHHGEVAEAPRGGPHVHNRNHQHQLRPARQCPT